MFFLKDLVESNHDKCRFTCRIYNFLHVESVKIGKNDWKWQKWPFWRSWKSRKKMNHIKKGLISWFALIRSSKKIFQGSRLRFERQKMEVQRFYRFFHTFFAEIPYKLEIDNPTISPSQKILKKIMGCCFMMSNDPFTVRSDLKTFRFSGTP